MGCLAQDGFDVPVSLDILGAGHPDYEQHLHQLVQDWHIEDRVTFHTPIERAKLPAFLAQYDALVMPSIWEEPQARISQEAMAAGLVLRRHAHRRQQGNPDRWTERSCFHAG